VTSLARSAVVAAVLLAPPVCLGDPQIAITSVPPYAVEGDLEGVVTGVDDPAAYCVAPYIQVEGSGWWTKPTFAEPCVPVNADGSFEADVTVPGTLDARATLFAVRLLPAGQVPPQAGGADSLPDCPPSIASDTYERYGRTLSFADRTWGVKESPDTVGPGWNRFSMDTGEVWVDASDRLHLTVGQKSGHWYATEVILTESLGYGQYLFQTSSRVDDLDSNLVFGAFTWDAYGAPSLPDGRRNREVDFEDSRWGDPAKATNSQFVVQPAGPDESDPNKHPFALPDLAADARLTRVLLWEEGRLRYLLLDGHHGPDDWTEADVVEQWEYRHDPAHARYVPEPGEARWRFNLWLLDAGVPAGDGATEVVVDSFAFAPVTVVWDGTAGPGWDVGGTLNWTSHGGLRPYFNPDGVVFDDSAPGSSSVQVTETVRPAGVVVDNSAVDYEWTGPGSIAGSGGLTKRGGGTLTIATDNAYTGPTCIEAGTVRAASDGALGESAVVLGETGDNAPVALLAAGPLTLPNAITVQDDGDPAFTRTLGGLNATGAAVFSGDVALHEDLLLTAEAGGEVRLPGPLHNTAGCTLTKVGGGTVIFEGEQHHGPGSRLEVTEGLCVLDADAGGTGGAEEANLYVFVAGAELHFGQDQHLDTLDIADGGLVRFTGANVVVVRNLVMNGVSLGPMTLTPEPATLTLLAAGTLGVLLRRRRIRLRRAAERLGGGRRLKEK
jgi:autotransporter-associated beta strand protein